MDEETKQEGMRRAVGIMTAWLEREDDEYGLMIEQILAQTDDGENAEAASMLGLADLYGHLLTMREGKRE